MGIYSNGNIFGIQIYNFNDDDIGNILFEEKSDEVMTHNKMREAYLFYTNLNDKNNICFTPFYISNADPLGRRILM